MRTPFFLCLALPLLASSGADAAKPARFFPYRLKVDTLKNGLTVVRVPFHSPGLVAYVTAVRVGARNEVEKDHTGFAHFFEHMMFKGTPTYPEGARDRLLASLGFDDNAFTTEDMTIYHEFGPSSALDTLIEVEADRFEHLTYAEPSFQTESKAVLGEYNKGAAHPEQKIEETLALTAFTRHPYQHTTIGFEADILRMPGYYEYSKEFFRRWYTPDNAIVFVVGDFDDAKVMSSIHARYDGWAGTAAKIEVPAEPPQTAERTAHIDWKGPTLPRHVVAWHTPGASVKTTDAAVQSILSGYLVGPTSPLYRSLVLDKQLCEWIGAESFPHRDPSVFAIQAGLKDDKNRPQVALAIDAAVAELATGKVDATRFEAIRSNLRYGLLMELETANAVALRLAVTAATFGTPDAVEAEAEAIAAVKPKDLSNFAQRYLVTTNRTVLTLTPAPSSAAPGAAR